ncbi:glucan biosynthesis protein [Caulobacter sp. NIBR2454]|uniref:glucan biosynthesis protein n=1 Tax=Caulobacter sp. NIBR2454 TaxID=3015996 RepID=UPI0022B688A9|nr:glucan biosynthesis protein G [Caulobacter sp. NIBR2454]
MADDTPRSGAPRRDVFAGLAALAGLMAVPRLASAQAEGAAQPFSQESLRAQARALAARPYAPPPQGRSQLEGLSYDQYRQIRFNKARQLWAPEGLAFRAEFFPPAFMYPKPVELFEVMEGQARAIAYAPDFFTFPEGHQASGENMGGFSGLRLLWPINRPDVLDEIGVFQGASYFRSLGKGNYYGASARGLAIGTGEPNEEFPVFNALWIERPAAGQGFVTVHALMDSPSVAGAYSFKITPGQNTVYEVDAAIYPRKTIDKGGVAAMSSMYLFGLSDRPDDHDFRTSVHDSDGLAMWTGRGERIWRPLANPKSLRLSSFEDDSPRGFGLLQRERDIEAYGDLEARYDKRPGIWVEPLEDWGPGRVHLVEIATRKETDDNIAIFWRPIEPWKAGQEVTLRYRLHFGNEPYPSQLARVRRTRAGEIVQEGAAGGSGARMFTIDFEGIAPDATGRFEDVEAEMEIRGGELLWRAVGPYPAPNAARAAFGFKPTGREVELMLRLKRGGQPVSETWRHRWSG